MTRKFYRQVFTVEVLSEDVPLRCDNLSEIDYAITYGDRSGMVNETVCEEVTAEKMAQLLMDQGSDPEFFRIDEDGNDLEGGGDYANAD